MNRVAVTVAAAVQETPWLSAAAVLVAGLVLALLVRFLLSRLLALVRFDALCDRIGVSEFLRKGMAKNKPSALVGLLAFWVILVISFFWIAGILDIRVLSSVSERIVRMAPGVVAAIFVGIIGVVVLSFLANFVSTLARNAAYPHTRLLARLVKVGGGVLIVLLALEQIGLSGTLLSSLVLIIVAAGALGAALAFGLGCKDLARDAMLKFLADLRERDRAGKGSDLEG